MRNYEWWKKQKRRVQKKYTLLCSIYLSPKELKYDRQKLAELMRKNSERYY